MSNIHPDSAPHNLLVRLDTHIADLKAENAALREGNERLAEATETLVKNYQYMTPTGTMNCRYCDNNMDDLGTGRELHDDDCPIVAARTALAAHRSKTDAD